MRSKLMPERARVALITLFVLFLGAIGMWALAIGSAPTGAGASTPASLNMPASVPAYVAASSRASQGAGMPHSPVAPNCGPHWGIISSPNVGTDDNYLHGVAIISSSDVWAVGSYNNGTVFRTLVEHWNGSSWIVVYSPNVGTDDNYLNGVAAVSTDDVWAVGYYSNGNVVQTLVEHWDGTAWVIVYSPNVGTNPNIFYGVAAVSTDDVWAVGTSMQTLALVEHWDGNTWSVVSSPNVGTGNTLYGIAAISSSDVWAVGSYSNGNVVQTLVEHWDGNTWSVVSSPNVGTDNTLYGIAAISSSDVWAVGSYYNSTYYQTLVEHWNGSQWIIVYSPSVGSSHNFLRGVAAVSADNVWAVGDHESALTVGTVVEHWDGTSWSIIPSPDPITGVNALSGVAVVSSSDVWAVGSNHASTDHTLVERYNPCIPSPTPTTTPTACTIQYTDVPTGSTFYPFIHCLACRGIVNGYPDGSFKPNNPVTRGQLSKIVSNSAGYSETHTEITFQDVPVGSTFYQFIERLATRGFISGYACGNPEPCVPPGNLPYFRPGANVTRGQTSKIVASAKGLPSPPAGQHSFQDVPVGSTFWQWIEALATSGAINGYPCGNPEPCVPPGNLPYFRPNANVTRGQSTKIVGNTFFPNCQTPSDFKQ